MSVAFPSRDFDDAVAAVCHGVASEEQVEALGRTLRRDAAARDEYLRRVALHAYLASEPDLFAASTTDFTATDGRPFSRPPSTTPSPKPPIRRFGRTLRAKWKAKLALAAGLVAFLAAVVWLAQVAGNRRGATSRAVAMLNRAVDARWDSSERAPRLGAPLEPGRLKLDSGLAQIVFYNGARVVIEGPAELQLVSSSEAICVQGKLTAEAPPQARGFRIVAPRLDVTDLGTAFGLKVNDDRSELHVFEGHVEFRSDAGSAAQDLREGKGAVVEGAAAPKLIEADPKAFAELFDLQAKSVAAEARRYDQWRESIRKLQRDPSLWVHFDFEHGGAPAWRLPNSGTLRAAAPEAAIVGCEWREGRWATKPALEFRGISDRVRLKVPGELRSVTLATWVRVQGLDRTINSLFMSEGFLPGTLHWVIRNDGALGLTAFGEKGGYQILASPPVLTIDQFGIWTHLAVVLDGRARQVTHFLNGQPVSSHPLRMAPPFRIGTAELGNWNAHGDPGDDPLLIRNFSGAMDEFCLFNRALTPGEISSLYADGRPQPDTVAGLPPSFPTADHLAFSTSSPIPIHR
ncbi:MAG TPA: FecR domain-containing protein [Verrucomicrobiota bacterium]|nr:FecR domain-containing protein [Verrucomicrobiota bacterium]